jgi:cellulose synthase/poly-beta-1,6-N-acetylglucosamine synthase-like glycosyltransferase
VAELIFWAALFLIVFAYVGYSAAILLLSRLIDNPPKRDAIEPTITLIITAYNEAASIARKLEQTLGLDYPSAKLEIIVASDGSTDGTDEIVRGFADRGVKLLRVEGRVGKTGAQNAAVRQARGEILVFSDATTTYRESALRMLVRNYADDTVGAVSGRYEYVDPNGTPIGKGSILFWRYENWIKSAQSNILTITGCCGCIYSVRRDRYVPLPNDIISDLCEPLKVIERGHRIVFEKEAVAYEDTTANVAEEFSMRVRVMVRGMRGILFMRRLLNPFKFGFVAFQLISHKVLRWMVPLFLSMLLLSNFFLLGRPLFDAALALQLVFYGIALVGYVGENVGMKLPLSSVPVFFVTVNIASVVALCRILKGQRAVVWETVRK